LQNTSRNTFVEKNVLQLPTNPSRPIEILKVECPRIATFYFERSGDNSRILIIISPLLNRLILYKEIEPIVGSEIARRRVTDCHDKDL